ncbi:hypothetical protein [Luteitalea pratensis]|uniref:hypothetical protein n=1 Tax=Luteitalea pratensis TaxID=1855912 RepID=UPI000D7305A4|nr:hypothetical protein [Luteitalea pratensis]
MSGDGGGARTGMPSATAGQTDERSAAGQQGGQVYHLMADASTDLSKHVGHEIEVTGSLTSTSAGHSGMSQSGVTGGTATTGAGATGGGSGSSGYAGPGTSGSGSTGSGAAGGASAAPGGTAAMGAMASQTGIAGTLRVTNLKMIASTCK